MKKKNENTKYIIFTTSLETIIFRRKVWFFFMAFSSFYNKISGKFTNDNSCFCLLLNDWMDLTFNVFLNKQIFSWSDSKKEITDPQNTWTVGSITLKSTCTKYTQKLAQVHPWSLLRYHYVCQTNSGYCNFKLLPTPP